MALSSDLISQLVKVNKEPKKPSESTAYGTTVVYEGRTYVQLDGSDLLTPVNTTSSVKDGDRVTVLIKNHSATVTGNMSDPAASGMVVEAHGKQIDEFEVIVAYKVKTEELEAIHATIDKLEANVAQIGKLEAIEAVIEELRADLINVDRLTATDVEAINAKIENLEATFGTFTDVSTENLEALYADIGQLKAYTGDFTYVSAEVLEAIKADIKTLNVGKLSAEEADIKYATIEQLKSTNADIENLEADVADIDTLIFGSASGNVIQSEFANAVIAQLGNAQIKSAMIDSLAANKISAGDINTNNIRVVSEDGKLLISDETIQISDDTRVRVQIGKDASDDYSINIWDADGNLMFSKGGITDKAIKNAIIRNDMVASDANIAASKLNISSLFTEINGSTETIKSSKILMDADNQTLEVSFSQMKTDVNDLSNTVSSQGTDISVIKGQITSKVWEQDIRDALDGFAPNTEGLNELTTKYSELKQDVDSISTTVASHATKIDTVSGEVASVDNKVSQLEVDLEGFQTTVSETYATQEELELAESQISQNSGSITSLVTRTETVENKFEEYPTTEQMNSTIEQTADSITQTVSETYVDNSDRISAAETTINQLADSIAMLVTDENGSSLMTQTENGWSFDISNITNGLNSATESIQTLTEDLGGIDNTVSSLTQAVNDLGVLTDYVIITTYEGQPCIELGESENNFKLRITNTAIQFVEGSALPAYINNQKLMIEQAEVKNELQFGGFVWKTRSNGNMGILWKGVSS